MMGNDLLQSEPLGTRRKRRDIRDSGAFAGRLRTHASRKVELAPARAPLIWPCNALFGNWPTAADADWPDADCARRQGDRMLTSAGS
jgi:hypothetical protein